MREDEAGEELDAHVARSYGLAMTTESPLDDERMVTVETKLAYQEKTISDLSDVLAEQGHELAELRRRTELLERFAREFLEASNAANEKPPHY